MVEKKFDNIFNHFDIIHEWQTEKQALADVYRAYA